MVGPWLQSLWKAGKRLSDIEYLAIKEFDSKLVHNEGALTSTGTLCTLEASSGKDLYLASATVYVKIDQVQTQASVGTIELQADGTVIETASIGTESGTGGAFGIGYQIHFAGKGIKVVAGKALRLECTVLGTDISLEGTIYAFEETTGDSPAI